MKHILIAFLVGLLSFSAAHATPVANFTNPGGDFAIGDDGGFGGSVNGSFSDPWTFTVISNSAASAGVFEINFDNTGTLQPPVISDLTLTLSGPGVGLPMFATPHPASPGDTLTLNYSGLLAGDTYTLTVSGNASSPSNYNGFLHIAAVPLPPALPLMGSALIGMIALFVMRRRTAAA